MALHKVGERVKLRSGRIGNIKKVLFDSPMPTNTRYQVAMEPGAQLIGISGLDIIDTLPSLNDLPPSVRAASLGIRAFQQWPNIHRALIDVDEAMVLAKVKYVLQGSAAAVLHGAAVSQAPGDIDICVNDLRKASQALVPPKFATRTGGSLAVNKFRHANGTDIDLVMAQEFGVNIERRTSTQGAWILSLTETLCSILLRPTIRSKEIEAFNSLVLLEGNALTELDKQTVVKAMNRFSKGQIKSWEQIVESAKDANNAFNLGIR